MTENDSTGDLLTRVAPALASTYAVQREIGQGGMAAVCLALDLKHERPVAIKVFRPDVTGSMGAERFLREIKTTASLQHPHILALIDSGVADGLPYYVMPYVEGASLRDRLRRHPQLGLDETVKIATDAAAALDYAHRQGIVHRDVKPENILLKDGEALVADFGIAIAVRAAGGPRLTEAGFSLGTPHYMSPEQAAGDPDIDGRTDTYALACVVYEMLTGEPPHGGATAQAIMSKLMTELPTRVSIVRPDVPPHVEAAVHRALAKVPADRFASTADFALALTDPDRVSTGSRARRPKTGARRWQVPALVGLGVAAVAVATWLAQTVVMTGAAPAESRTRQLTFTGDAHGAALGPGGATVAYLGDNGRTLILREVDGEGERALIKADEPLGRPRWSPDGSRLMVAGSVDGQRGVFTVSQLGGRPVQIADRLMARRPQFGSYAAYDFAGNTQTYAVPCCGTRVYVGPDPSAITRVGPDSFAVAKGTLVNLGADLDMIVEVAVSPDGSTIAFVGMTALQRTVLGLASTTPAPTIDVVAAEDNVSLDGRTAFGSLQWAHDGQWIFYTQQAGGSANLMRVPVSTRRGATTGAPRMVLPNLPSDVSLGVAMERDRVVYAGGPNRTILELAERGVSQTRRLSRGTWTYLRPALSPDGKRLAYLKSVGDSLDLFVFDVSTGTEQRVAGQASALNAPRWSADGQSVAYAAATGDSLELRLVNVATQERRLITTHGLSIGPIAAVGSDGASVLLLRDGQRLASRDLATGAESAIELTALQQAPRDLELPAGPADPDSSRAAPPIGGGGGRAAGGRRVPRIMMPVLSPDERDIGVFVASPGQLGLWIVPVSGGAPRKLVSGVAVPLAWGNRNTIYFVQAGTTDPTHTVVEQVDATTGAVGRRFELPFRCELGDLTIARTGDRVVCAVREETSDVWLIDNLSLGR